MTSDQEAMTMRANQVNLQNIGLMSDALIGGLNLNRLRKLYTRYVDHGRESGCDASNGRSNGGVPGLWHSNACCPRRAG